jgi:hypothetical protein
MPLTVAQIIYQNSYFYVRQETLNGRAVCRVMENIAPLCAPAERWTCSPTTQSGSDEQMFGLK